MKDELGRRIMTEFVALRPKKYSYLMMIRMLKKDMILRIMKLVDHYQKNK